MRLPFRLERGSIGLRIVALFLGLLLLLQVASFTALRASLLEYAHSVLPDRLQTGERVLQRLLEQRAQKLIEGARLLATDYGFREALSSNDAETIASTLANHGARIGATNAALLSTEFLLRSATAGDAPALSALAFRLSAQAAATGTASSVALLSGKPYQAVLVPVKAPVLVAWVLMAVPLEAQLAGDLQDLSSLGLTLLTRNAPGAPWAVGLSGLDGSQAAALARQPWSAAAAPVAMSPVVLRGEEFGVRARWLSPGSNAADGPAVLALLSLSVDEAVRLPAQLQWALLCITLFGFFAFGVCSVFTARRLTTPIRELAAAAERLGAGDYATPIDGQQRSDEIGELAQSFERMRISVAEKQAEVRQLAFWDGLTGLPNRVQFRDAVRAAIDQAPAGGSVAVVMLDLNRFKHVNDVLGYRFGDLLLGAVAERLRQCAVRDGDLVARLGGDEFAVLFRNGGAALALAVAQRIERSFDAPLTIEEHTVDMGAGIGLACWPDHADSADLLLSRAEVAMYAAKRRTSGPLAYDPAIDAASAQTLSLLTELRQAVGQGELRLYLQPKLALDSAAIVGAEALVRWQHPRRGLVPPLQFIPFAEQTGFIRSLTVWVFEEAARHWLMLRRQGLSLKLSVNISTRDLLDQELPRKFEALLVRHQVPADAFCLEITESAIMDDPQRALATLDGLSAMGFTLSIDDFGTGYSSLAYLKKLPVDELKIDQSFVRSMETDSDDAMIVRSTIDLAHNLGLTVVAEGVENASAWNLLRELNCDHAQGFHMGRPMPAAVFSQWSVDWQGQRRRPSVPTNFAALH